MQYWQTARIRPRYPGEERVRFAIAIRKGDAREGLGGRARCVAPRASADVASAA